jgi:hypothetical protein
MVQKRACDACHKRKVRTGTQRKPHLFSFLGALAYLSDRFSPLDPLIISEYSQYIQGLLDLSASLTQLSRSNVIQQAQTPPAIGASTKV